jgi:V/A-type H+-transporting ATPase subunit K
MEWLGQLGLGLTLGLGAVGSALGIGAAGRAAAGAWSKEAREGKPLNFKYIILTAMPVSQTLYAFGLMLVILKSGVYGPMASGYAGAWFSIAVGCGLGELFSAWMQGAIGAAGIRAMSEGEGKPFLFCIIAMGIVESVGLFSFVLMIMMKGPAA